MCELYEYKMREYKLHVGDPPIVISKKIKNLFGLQQIKHHFNFKKICIIY